MDYKGRPKESGEFCSASQRILSYVRAGEPVPCLDGVVLDLKDGKYADFMYCVGAPRVVSARLKALFERFGAIEEGVRFYPVRTRSKEYGDRTYYVLHFTEVRDGALRTLAEYIELPPVSTRSLPIGVIPYWMRYALDYRRVKGLSVFTTIRFSYQLLVSEEVRDAMKREGLDSDVLFHPLDCAYVPEELIRKGYHSVNAPDPADRGDDLSRWPDLKVY